MLPMLWVKEYLSQKWIETVRGLLLLSASLYFLSQSGYPINFAVVGITIWAMAGASTNLPERIGSNMVSIYLQVCHILANVEICGISIFLLQEKHLPLSTDWPLWVIINIQIASFTGGLGGTFLAKDFKSFRNLVLRICDRY